MRCLASRTWGVVRAVTSICVFALPMVASAQTRERVAMPFSCSVSGGKVRLDPAVEQHFAIVGSRQQQSFTFCIDNDPQRCRTWMTHRFNMQCDGKDVAWLEVAAAAAVHARPLAAAQASIDLGRLTMQIGDRPRPGFLAHCRGGQSFVGRRLRERFERGADYDCFAERPRRASVVFPAGFAPMGIASARIVLPTATSTPLVSANGPVGPAMAAPPSTGALAPVNTSSIPAPPTPETPAARPFPVLNAPSPVVSEPAVAPKSPIDRTELPGAAPTPPIRRTHVSFVPAHRLESSSSASTRDPMASPATTPQPIAPPWATVVKVAEINAEPQSQARTVIVAGSIAVIAGLLLAAGWIFSWVLRARRSRHSVGINRKAAAGAATPPGGQAALLDEHQLYEIVRSDTVQHIAGIRGALGALTSAPPLRSAITEALHVLERRHQAIINLPVEDEEGRRRIRARLERVLHDLRRLREIGDSAVTSFTTGRGVLRTLPRDKADAYEALGVNADVDTRILKKLVDALRQSWHPDFARDEADRQIREERIKEINVAWELIVDKRAAG